MLLRLSWPACSRPSASVSAVKSQAASEWTGRSQRRTAGAVYSGDRTPGPDGNVASTAVASSCSGGPRGRRAEHGAKALPRCPTTRLRPVAPERPKFSDDAASRRPRWLKKIGGVSLLTFPARRNCPRNCAGARCVFVVKPELTRACKAGGSHGKPRRRCESGREPQVCAYPTDGFGVQGGNDHRRSEETCHLLQRRRSVCRRGLSRNQRPDRCSAPIRFAARRGQEEVPAGLADRTTLRRVVLTFQVPTFTSRSSRPISPAASWRDRSS
jgi:hypothetical protein